MPKRIGVQLARLRLKSEALFIGSQISELTGAEVVLDPPNVKDRRAYYLDCDKLAELFAARGDHALKKLVNAMSTSSPQLLSTIESTLGTDWKTSVVRVSLPIPPGFNTVGELRPFVRDGYDAPYIPGSSLKGCFRTALMYRHEKGDAKALNERVKQTIPRVPLPEAKRFMQRADLSLLQAGFSRPVHASTDASIRESAPHKDFLRVLRVGDSTLIAESVMRVAPVPVVTNVPRDDSSIPVYLEVATGVDVTFDVRFDRELALRYKEQARINSLLDLIDAVKEFAEAQWKAEQAYWRWEHAGQAPVPALSPSKFATPDAWKRELSKYAIQKYGKQIRGGPEEAERIRERYRLEFERENGPEPKQHTPVSARISESSSRDAEILRFYDGSCPYHTRLGAGSGMLGTTLGVLLEEPLRAEIRNKYGKKSSSPIAPLTRRLTHIGGRRVPLGWATLELEDLREI